MTALPLECEVGTVRRGEPLLVTVRGEIDLATSPELASCIHDALEGGPSSVTLDFAALAFIDSSGLRVLVSLSDEAQSRGSAIVLQNVPRHVERVLELTGLADRFLPRPGG